MNRTGPGVGGAGFAGVRRRLRRFRRGLRILGGRCGDRRDEDRLINGVALTQTCLSGRSLSAIATLSSTVLPRSVS